MHYLGGDGPKVHLKGGRVRKHTTLVEGSNAHLKGGR